VNIQVELSNVCQLSCVECPQRLMKRRQTFMSQEVFNRVIEYIGVIPDERYQKGYPPTIILHKDGESLLHPRLKEYIKQISDSQPDYRLNLYTNGLRLSEGFIDFLGSLPNLVWLLVSFHFYNADGSYNDYSEVYKTFDSCLQKNYKNIEFIFTSHVTRFCSEEALKTWETLLSEKNYKIKPFVALNTHINPWTDLIHEENSSVFDGCPYMDFGHLFIGSTGNVVPCCMDLEEELCMGNIMTDPYNRIFSRLERFYDRLQNKRNFEPLCLKCMKGSKYVESVL
jgi:radical SAM protein with 4Fe4S-binding SPASM domain